MTQEITLSVSYSFTGDCTRLPVGILHMALDNELQAEAVKVEMRKRKLQTESNYRNTNMLGGISLFHLFRNSPPVWTSRRRSYRKRIRPAGNALPQAPCGRCPWSPYRSVPAWSLPWKRTSLLGSERLETCRSHAGDTEVSEWNYRPDVSLWAELGVCENEMWMTISTNTPDLFSQWDLQVWDSSTLWTLTLVHWFIEVNIYYYNNKQ